MIISNLDDIIISNANGNNDTDVNVSLADVGLKLDRDCLGKSFTSEINGEKHFCIARFVEGYYIIGVVPTHEVQSFRDRAAATNILTEIIIFALMFFFIYKMISAVIVSKIHNINHSLNRIIEGELDTKVDEYSTKEFSELSDDINSTVKSLKDYMNREQERIKQELEFAKSIQMSALPKVDSLDRYRSGYELYATMDPAKEVGGDFYDFYTLDESRLVILIADVSSKGVPAAMFMMTCKTMIKNLVESGLPLDKVFNKANEELCRNNDAGMFVTVWMGILDVKTGHLQYVNAGHNQPLLYDENGEFVFLKDKPGLVMAGMPGMEYKIRERYLKHGDKVFLYTDGVTEANNARHEMYGQDRLRAYLNDSRDKSPDELLPDLKSDIDNFADGAEQFDDITMLAVCYE